MRRLLIVVSLLGAAVLQAPLAEALPNWQPGPGATGDATITGAIDAPTAGAMLPTDQLIPISGWVVDTAAQGWSGIDDVQVFSGTMDSGTLVSHPTVGISRPDVAGTMGNPFWSNAGWTGTLDTGALAPGQDLLAFYAHTPGKGWWVASMTVSVGSTTAGDAPRLLVSTPVPGEQVSDRLPSYRVSGTATDPAHGPNAIDYVEVWLNSEQGAENGTLLGAAEFDRKSGEWFIDFNPAQYPQIESNLYVYAHSAVTGKRTLVVVHFAIVDRPL